MVMGELATKTGVAVIGGGPGGYTAAIRAAQLGQDVILIEQDKLGGCCTNVGCIPSKALIHAATLRYEAGSETAKEMGIDAQVRLDFAKTMQWKDGVVKSLREGIASLCRMNGIEVIKGRAFFTSSDSLSVQTESAMREIRFDKAIIATGTKITELGGLPFGKEGVISSDAVFAMQSLPERLLIVGGGYVAVEMAAMFAKFGSKVTVSYRGERLLRNMENELGEAALKGLQGLGAEVIFHSTVQSAKAGTAVVKTAGGTRNVGYDSLLVAAGRSTDFGGLGLEKTAVKIADGLISVDGAMRTADGNIYAVGDVVAGPQLAHKAFRQGKVAAEHIAGKKSAYDNMAMPMVVFTEPELASVGLGEGEARKQGHDAVTGRMPLSASGRAKTAGKPEGFVKIVADRQGTVLGVHIAGYDAGALIAEAALAIEMGAQLEDIAATIHAHPTMPESLMESAEDALGKSIHLFRKR